MINQKIKRFCELISHINIINARLDKERAEYYDGGYSFEELNAHTIKELVDMQDELKALLKELQTDAI
jgi:hypothetical protein